MSEIPQFENPHHQPKSVFLNLGSNEHPILLQPNLDYHVKRNGNALLGIYAV